ncbi:MAG TPA: hypothetical protein VFH45_11765 [Acidimicrobiales bacterium]|nr:hypothetical protein [Acidimicrobiales bacterium]
MADLGKLARDAGFTALGLAVLQIQRIQVRRRELEAEVNARLGAVGRMLRPDQPDRT